MRACRVPGIGAAVLGLGLVLACEDGNPVTEGGPNLSGRWIYRASELRGTEVVCETSDVVLTLVRTPGSLHVDARFDGSAFPFRVECRRGDQTATLLFTDGTSVVNGEVLDGVVGFDFSFPDFLHTGTVEDDVMSGVVATRLDLTQSPLSQVGMVNLIGEWTSVRDGAAGRGATARRRVNPDRSSIVSSSDALYCDPILPSIRSRPMSHWIGLCALCLAALLPRAAGAQDAPVDSLALARQYTAWLYAGESDSLLAHSTEETRAERDSDDAYKTLSQMIAQRAGVEIDVSEETWKLRNGDCQYWRVSQFSLMEEPILIRWVLDRQGRIAGFGAGPYTQAPPVEAETCAIPPS